MKEILELLFKVSVLAFVIGSMVAMGLSLTVGRIIRPLKDAKRVALSLLANFVLVPVFVYGTVHVLPLPEGVRIGLIILSLAAGSPFLPKLVQIAKSDTAFSIALMLLLMIVTLFYLPLILPLLLSGVEVSSWAIAKSLILLMLIPLALALAVRARFEAASRKAQPVFVKISNIALLALTIALIVLHSASLLDLFGPPILAILLLLVVATVIGYLLGGPGRETRFVLSLGTGLRNISAALLVATQNFQDPDITLTLVALALLGLLIFMPYARWTGMKAA